MDDKDLESHYALILIELEVWRMNINNNGITEIASQGENYNETWVVAYGLVSYGKLPKGSQVCWW